MNELIRSLKFYLEGNGGIEFSDAVNLSLRLSETLMGAIDYDQPDSSLQTIIERFSITNQTCYCQSHWKEGDRARV
ncbi:MAG TPA: hypothetical protein V6C65_03720 [Allocoleopsis sp.]